MNRSDNIIIVGGGSAGWSTAVTLNRFFPNKNITVIESPDVPRIGVGESTLEHFTFWLHSVGVDKSELFKYCDATYKFSIKFVDFHKIGDGGYHYPFGAPDVNEAIFKEFGLNAWQYKKLLYPETPVQDYCRTYFPQMSLIENSRIHHNQNKEFGNYNFNRAYAFHFDAVKFANYLRDNVCIPRGVKHIAGTVDSINTNDDGIESLVLSDGQVITADLFIDCTGFKALLMKKLDAEWISYDHMIPNNRAWAVRIPYTNKRIEMQTFTNCTALGNGWVWNTPTKDRLGTGYVYSDKYTTPEAALQEFKDYLRSDRMTIHDPNRDVDSLEFRDIPMKIGIHKKTWIKNCVSIGLSAGFIEPLESTGLFTTCVFVMRLAEVLTDDGYNQIDISNYNTICRADFDGLCKFVSIHYALTQRDDTQYWRDIRNRDYNGYIIPENASMPFTQSNPDFYTSELLTRKYFSKDYDANSGTHCIMVGNNFNPIKEIDVVKGSYYGNGPSMKQLEYIVSDIVEKTQKRQKNWLEHTKNAEFQYDYLMRTYWS